MIEKIEYLIKKGHAAIYRCYGEGPYLELPDTIDGYVVEELCDHCFAREASVREKKAEIRTITRAQLEGFESSEPAVGFEPADTEYPAMCALNIEEIALPRHLVSTGDYCFYGCDNLKKLTFPATFKRFGGGAFVAANHLSKVDFYIEQVPENPEDPGTAVTPRAVRELFSEITDELEVKILKPDGSIFYRLHYPGYVEIGLENTPARIIELRFEGMGYKYRLSAKGNEIDFAKYDGHFYESTIQELPETVIQIALDRLAYPIRLDEKSKEAYTEWLKQEYKVLADYIVPAERTEMLQVLIKNECFTQEGAEHFLEKASAKKQAEMVTLLMEYKRKHFKAKRNRYSFD